MAPKTDFTPESVFHQRFLHHQNDRIVGTTNVFVVPFDPDFDQFSASVAHALRHLIVYRTDGGNFARGLVRASGWLERVHNHLVEVSRPKGMPTRLLARLFRRRDPVAANRWVLTIEFALAKEDTIDGNDDDEIIHATLDVSDKSGCALMNQIIHDTTILFSDPHKSHGIRAKRILKMLAVADRVGCRKAEDLWFYTSSVAFAYVQLFTGDPARKRMTAATNGQFPFDGNSGPDASNVPWRTYPFRDAARACMGHDPSTCRDRAAYQIAQAEIQFSMSIDAIFREKAKLGLVSSFNSLPSDSMNAMVPAFMDHINSMIKDADSLYSIWF
jgi:hypothetical protein